MKPRLYGVIGSGIGAALGLLVVVLGGSAQATNYTVSPSGTDSGAGPWKTLQYAADHVAAGDVVTVEDGTYAGLVMDSVSGSASQRIVFVAKNRLGAKITSASASGGFPNDWVVFTSSSFITFSGFEVSGAGRAGISVLGNTDDGSDATDVIIEYCHSHDNGGGSSAGRHDGIFTGFARNVVIRNNTSNGNSEHGIYVSNAADNPIIERNDVYGNTVNGIQINADLSTGGDGIITNWRITQNRVHGNQGAAAINLDGAVSGLLANNLVYGNAKAGITLFMGDGAVASHDNVVVNNTVYNPSGTRAALQVAAGADNNVVFNNILYSGSGAGLEVQTVSGLQHDYNLVSTYDGATAAAHESSPSAAGLFSNLAGNDYTLASSSAAKDAGAASLGGKSAPSVDLVDGSRPVGSFDVGCYESGAAPVGDAGSTAADLASPVDQGGGSKDAGGSGADAGSVVTDGGSGADLSSPATGGGGSKSGCGCHTSGTSPVADALLGLLALAGLVGFALVERRLVRQRVARRLHRQRVARATRADEEAPGPR